MDDDVNGFEMHGIRHLSASSLNSYAAQPALWAMERLLNKWSAGNCAMHRGTAAEAGVTAGLLDPEMPVERCQEIALAKFDELAALSGDPNREKEREVVPAIMASALSELRQYGVPDEVQKKIVVELPGIPVPIIGYLDFAWSVHGVLVDMKSAHKLVSEIAPGHARQCSLYVLGTNRQARVCYATPKKVGVYVVENPAEHVAAMTEIAKRLGRFLELSKDPHDLLRLLVPDYGSFYWGNPTTRALGREIYGF